MTPYFALFPKAIVVVNYICLKILKVFWTNRISTNIKLLILMRWRFPQEFCHIIHMPCLIAASIFCIMFLRDLHTTCRFAFALETCKRLFTKFRLCIFLYLWHHMWPQNGSMLPHIIYVLVRQCNCDFSCSFLKHFQRIYYILCNHCIAVYFVHVIVWRIAVYNCYL